MPGKEPPTSSTCAVTAANPSSSPSWKIGTATATSGECEAPRYGWLCTITSPSSSLPSSRWRKPRMYLRGLTSHFRGLCGNGDDDVPEAVDARRELGRDNGGRVILVDDRGAL